MITTANYYPLTVAYLENPEDVAAKWRVLFQTEPKCQIVLVGEVPTAEEIEESLKDLPQYFSEISLGIIRAGIAMAKPINTGE